MSHVTSRAPLKFRRHYRLWLLSIDYRCPSKRIIVAKHTQCRATWDVVVGSVAVRLVIVETISDKTRRFSLQWQVLYRRRLCLDRVSNTRPNYRND